MEKSDPRWRWSFKRRAGAWYNRMTKQWYRSPVFAWRIRTDYCILNDAVFLRMAGGLLKELAEEDGDD